MLTPAAATAAFEAKGGALYTKAEIVFSFVWEASVRVKYSIVGKLHEGFVAGTPVAYPLDHFAKQLNVSSADSETFDFAGKE